MASTTEGPGGRQEGAGEGREERLRLFVALSLPPDAREALGAWQRAVLRGRAELRGVEVATLHATLCFLGWRPAGEVELIAGACRAMAAAGAARLRFAGALWLPPRRPGVLAVELEDLGGTLAPAQAALSGTLAEAGVYRPEARPFLAHVTVARLRRRERLRGRELQAPPPSLTFEADTVTLYRSNLARGGASYEALVTVPLG
jgi:RNA 2',3'-cyclic 3'-phosphodiesterase